MRLFFPRRIRQQPACCPDGFSQVLNALFFLPCTDCPPAARAQTPSWDLNPRRTAGKRPKKKNNPKTNKQKNASRTLFTLAGRAQLGGERLSSRLREAESCAGCAPRARRGRKRSGKAPALAPFPSLSLLSPPGHSRLEKRSPASASPAAGSPPLPAPSKLNFQNFPRSRSPLEFREPISREGPHAPAATEAASGTPQL